MRKKGQVWVGELVEDEEEEEELRLLAGKMLAVWLIEGC